MLYVTNKRNNLEGTAVELEDGKFNIKFDNGDEKTVAASTFNRWYKVNKEVSTDEEQVVGKVGTTVDLETIKNDIDMEEQMDAELSWNEQGDQEVQKDNRQRCPECEGFGEVVGEHDGPQPTCPTCKGEGRIENEITIGSYVETLDGTVGRVEDIVGTLATVATSDEELPVNLNQLQLTNKKPKEEVVTEQPVEVTTEPKVVKTTKKEKVNEVKVEGLIVTSEIAEGAKSEKSVHFNVQITLGENVITFKKACFRKNLQGRITKATVNGEVLKGNSISITKVLEPLNLTKEQQKFVKNTVNNSIKETFGKE